MQNTGYIGLLRGINVGGKNVIRMSELKAFFEKMGFSDVATYIQSGNVLFNSGEADKSRLEEQIEERLTEQFGAIIRLVLLTTGQLSDVVREAPREFGKEPGKYKYDVLFLKEPLRAGEAIREISVREDVDKAFAGKGVLYFSRLTSKAAQSHLTKIIQLPVYRNLTIRNWNTVTKLLALCEVRQ